jgi:hypothetical protein
MEGLSVGRNFVLSLSGSIASSQNHNDHFMDPDDGVQVYTLGLTDKSGVPINRPDLIDKHGAANSSRSGHVNFERPGTKIPRNRADEDQRRPFVI